MSSHLKKLFILSSVVAVTLTFAGCSASQPAANEDATPGQSSEKKGDTTLSGTLTNKGGKYFLEQTGKQPQPVESYSVTLGDYVDQNVTITGQFSGDTLFAGKIETK